MPGRGHLPRGRGPRGDGELHSQKRRLLRVTTPVAFHNQRRGRSFGLPLISQNPEPPRRPLLLGTWVNKGPSVPRPTSTVCRRTYGTYGRRPSLGTGWPGGSAAKRTCPSPAGLIAGGREGRTSYRSPRGSGCNQEADAPPSKPRSL